MRLKKETVLASLHLMKIHWLMIKLDVVRGFSYLTVKIHH